jgi:hypothetical protein
MSGRRLRNAVQDTIISNGGPEDTKPVITGHSNDYTNYIATPEEYQVSGDISVLTVCSFYSVAALRRSVYYFWASNSQPLHKQIQRVGGRDGQGKTGQFQKCENLWENVSRERH